MVSPTWDMGSNFIQKVNGEIIIANYVELICKVKVLNLLQILEPIQLFYMKGQRCVDNERVDNMLKLQQDEYQQKQFYGITTTLIIMGFCQQHVGAPVDANGRPMNKNEFGLVVLDGQHRMAVFRRLKMWHEETLSSTLTLIKICKFNTEFELLEYFQLINKNYVPVPMYNLDDQIRVVVDDVLNWFSKSFDAKFFRSPSGETLRPFLKMETIRDKLSNSLSLREIISDNGGEQDNCVTIVCDK